MGVVAGVDDFVAGEEEEEIVWSGVSVKSRHQMKDELTVAGEVVDGAKEASEVDIVVALMQCRQTLAVQAEFRGIRVQSEVDASRIEHLHSFIVVLAVVHGVYSDRVDTEFLKLVLMSELDRVQLDGATHSLNVTSE